MKILYDPTTFNEEAAPGWSAAQANKVGNGIKANAEAISSLPTDPATFNPTGSSASNYKITSYRISAPEPSECPLSMIIIPNVANAANATITPSWGSTAYPIWDATTGNQVTAGTISEDIPVNLLFDGSKFWVTGLSTKANIVHASEHASDGSDPLTASQINAVSYLSQTLTTAQKTQARTNIGAGTPITVVHSFSSTSATSALSAHIGGVLANEREYKREVKWVNPDATQSFAAQTISEAWMTVYDRVFVYPYVGKTQIDLGIQQPIEVPKDTTKTICIPWRMNIYRTIQFDDTGITFGDAKYYPTYNSATTTTDNAYFIPGEIRVDLKQYWE